MRYHTSVNSASAVQLVLKDEVKRSSAAPYLNLSGAFVPTAGNMDYKRPFIWLHEYSSSLGTCGVVGSGTPAMRALHTAARRLLHPLFTVVTFLLEIKTKKPGLTKVQWILTQWRWSWHTETTNSLRAADTFSAKSIGLQDIQMTEYSSFQSVIVAGRATLLRGPKLEVSTHCVNAPVVAWAFIYLSSRGIFQCINDVLVLFLTVFEYIQYWMFVWIWGKVNT